MESRRRLPLLLVIALVSPLSGCAARPSSAQQAVKPVSCPAYLRQDHNAHTCYPMPCPRQTEPNQLTVRWTEKSGQDTSHGMRNLGNTRETHRLYQAICAVPLVKYREPVALVCPNFNATFSYAFEFRRGRARVLSVHESSAGCSRLTVPGRPELGSSFRIYLPIGVPAPPGITER
jgi:hypothetical protein